MDLVSHRFNHTASPIKSPPPLHSYHNSFPIIVVAVIGILATAFLLVSYYVFVIKCCLNWHRIDLLRRFSFSRRRRAEEPLVVYSPAVGSRGLDEAAIRSIPIFKFEKLGIQEHGKSVECAVCLNEFREQEKLRVIPNCAHVFHIDCIDIWLQNNANCPLCRTSISAARPEICFPIDQILAPSPSPQDPTPHTETFTGRDEDYVVIEIGSEQGTTFLPRIPDSGELLSISPSPRKASRKKAKKYNQISSMGDECIDNRRKDEQFMVQTMRRSFSMDSAADSQLYLAVQEIIQRHGQVINEANPNEGCSSSSSGSRVRRSFFSFGQGRGSRSSVQPVALRT